MNYYEVAPNKIVRAGSRYLTYASSSQLPIGSIVTIPVGKSTSIGVIFRSVEKPNFETKELGERIENGSLPAHLLGLSTWLSDYYATPLPQIIQALLPTGVGKNRRKNVVSTTLAERERTTNVFTADQEYALTVFSEMSPGTGLLHGITGSGKTAVYIELARRTVQSGRSVIVLVPEIALTSQLVAEFSHHFPDILLTHSKQTDSERHAVWRKALTNNQPTVVIGPRSALFMPLHDIGLILIDECHEPSFKQEQAPRYSALRAASELVRLTSGKLILGSATPLVSDYFVAEHSDRPIVVMNKSARKDTVKPSLQMVDMTKRSAFKKHRFISDALLATIEKNLAAKEQVLIFHNRRGSASTTLCENCGWQAGCPKCYIPLTLHADNHELRCHICAYRSRVPTSCPECGKTDIIHKGIGTKLIESELVRLFPKAIIRRFDGDSDATVEAHYNELYRGDIDIIVGTQVLAKGLDLPHLRTVGVVQADAGLALPDFSSPERTFQLLSQVVGRVGRSHHPTNVIVQSYQPDHPAVVDGLAQNYMNFYNRTLALRKHTKFPPYVHLLKLVCVYKTEAAAVRNAKKLADELRRSFGEKIEILGPTPSFYEYVGGTYRWQLVIKSTSRDTLIDALQFLPPSKWQYELDPISLL